MLGAELKSPKPLDWLNERCAGGGCVGGLAAVTGFGGCFGVVSKKPPPLIWGVTCGAAGVARELVMLAKFAKGVDFDCCWGGGAGAEVGEVKLSPLKASSRPPKLEGG